MQSTQAVARDINPVFNCTLTMPRRERGEVLRVTLRDFGMLGSTPKVVATATLLAGEEFTGHLEMVVSSAKRELGNPVLQLIVRWAWYDAQDPARPAATVEAMSQQAASAPALMEAIPEADVDKGALGRDRSPWVLAHNASPFYIQDAVRDWLENPDSILQDLHRMQQRGEKGVFEGDNYNCWACGWQPAIEDWDKDHLWGPVGPPENLPPDFDKVLEGMRRLSADEDDPAWTWGVVMLVKLLENLKARCVQRNAVQWNVMQCSGNVT